MFRRFLACSLILSVIFPCFAADRESMLITARPVSFYLSAPEGWMLDLQSGLGEGLPAVLYPEGSSWENGQTLMYANAVEKETPHQTLADFIDADLARFKSESPKLKIKPEGTLTTADGKIAQVYELERDRAGNYERVAFIEESKGFVTLALTSRLKRDWMGAFRAFEELVSSYKLNNSAY